MCYALVKPRQLHSTFDQSLLDQSIPRPSVAFAKRRQFEFSPSPLPLQSSSQRPLQRGSSHNVKLFVTFRSRRISIPGSALKLSRLLLHHPLLLATHHLHVGHLLPGAASRQPIIHDSSDKSLPISSPLLVINHLLVRHLLPGPASRQPIIHDSFYKHLRDSSNDQHSPRLPSFLVKLMRQTIPSPPS